MFEVGGNTCNNASQLATQQCCVASCSNLTIGKNRNIANTMQAFVIVTFASGITDENFKYYI